MLCFQQCYLIAGALRRRESSARERKTDAPAQRISCVFVCIFLPLQREMRGCELQLSSQLGLGM